MEKVICNLCGSDSQKLLYKKPDTWTWFTDYEFSIVKCLSCGLVFVNPRPDVYEMSNYYPNGYHANRDTVEHRKRYEIQTQFLPVLENESVLDIGCAYGDFLLYLKEKYKKIEMYGCDLFSDSFKSKEINFKNMALVDAGYKDSQFDLITAWAVFEHLHDPDSYFKEVKRILKSGGKFVFLVTNSESLYGRMAYIEDVPRHLYHFSKKTLQKYAIKHGLKINRIVYNDRLFDGRGTGSFKYFFENIMGVNWKIRRAGSYSRLQRYANRLGSSVDRFVFKYHWEEKLGVSGIMIIEMEK